MVTIFNSSAYAINQRRFEHGRVKMLVNAFEFPKDKRKHCVGKLMEYAGNNSMDGEGWLTFADLDVIEGLEALRVADRCPVRLAALPFPDQLFRYINLHFVFRIQKTFLYARFLSRWRSRLGDDERPFGLIFGLNGIPGGVILHDAELPGLTGRTTLHYYSSSPNEPAKLTLEPYRAFLLRMMRSWRMELGIAKTQQHDISPRLDKWMVSKLGSGPAVIVLAWLWGACLDSEQRYYAMRDGKPYLALRQSIIASETGLSDDSVKEAMKRLRKEAVIITERGDHRTYVAVVQPAK